MEFQARTVYTQEDFIGFTYIIKKQKKHRTFYAVFLVMLCILLGLRLISIIYDAVRYRGSFLYVLPVLLIFFALIFFLLYAFSAKNMGKTAWNRHRAKGELIVISFGINGIHDKTSLSESVSSYRTILRICEDAQRFYLFTEENRAYLIKKTDFVVGDSAQFPAFISTHTGLPVKRY